MEMIHSRSYTYIIKNIYSDPSEVFDKIVSDNRILERAASVTEAYDDFIGSAHQYDNSSDWQHALEQVPPHWMESMNSNVNSTEQSQTLTFLKVFGSTLVLLVVFAFGELKALWKDQLKSLLLIARDENQHLAITQNILNKWAQGDDPEMKQIMKEEEEWTYRAFDRAVNEEKRWADYLFKDGSMIGLNDKLLQQYVEWIANRRLKAIGLRPQYDIAAKNNPLPWTQHWISSKGLQVAPQETEVESYVVGGIKQDVKKDTFSGFQL